MRARKFRNLKAVLHRKEAVNCQLSAVSLPLTVLRSALQPTAWPCSAVSFNEKAFRITCRCAPNFHGQSSAKLCGKSFLEAFSSEPTAYSLVVALILWLQWIDPHELFNPKK
jgi:hypothetical protein